MLALSLTALAAAFFLGPELLSRWVLGFVVPRRSLSSNKGEEITRAVMWAILPLVLAIAWVNTHGVLRLWGGWRDVRLVLGSLYSSNTFDKHDEEFFVSFLRVSGMVWSLLWRLYFIVLLTAAMLDLVTLEYRRLRAAVRFSWAKTALATIVLPRVSEWHVILSEMLLPVEDVLLVVDVLTKNGTLYQGRVQDRMLAADGSLLTLTLGDPKRFLREDFSKAKDGNGATKAEDFWRLIPSKLFVLIGSDIININVRYLPKSNKTPMLTRAALTEQDLQAVRELLSKLTAPQTAPESGVGLAQD